MVTSQKMIKTGKTSNGYYESLQKLVKSYIKQGKSEQEANTAAESILSMYKHTFAEFKEV